MCLIFKANYSDGHKAVGSIISFWGTILTGNLDGLPFRLLGGENRTKRCTLVLTLNPYSWHAADSIQQKSIMLCEHNTAVIGREQRKLTHLRNATSSRVSSFVIHESKGAKTDINTKRRRRSPLVCSVSLRNPTSWSHHEPSKTSEQLHENPEAKMKQCSTPLLSPLLHSVFTLSVGYWLPFGVQTDEQLSASTSCNIERR